MERLLNQLSRTLLARPAWVLLAALALPLLLALPILGASVDLSFTSVFSEDDEVAGPYFEMSERLRLSHRLQVLLEGEPEALELGAREARQALEALPGVVDSVVTEVPTEWLREQAPWLMPDPTFEQLLGVATGELTQDDETSWDPPEQRTGLSTTGARLILLDLHQDPIHVSVEDIKSGQSPYMQVERALSGALDPLELTWGITGLAAIASQDQAATLNTIDHLIPLSLLAVLVLLLLVEPRPGRLLLVALPMILAVLGTLGVVALVFGKLTFNEAFFGMFIFGLGVDYALHLLVRMREELATGEGFPAALTQTIQGAGRAILAGAVTTIGAFIAVGLAPDPQPRHMGVTGAVGLLLCLLLMLTLLPATWVLLQRGGETRASKPLEVPLVGRLARASAGKPGLVIAVVISLLGLTAAGIPHFRAETDLAKIFNRDVPAVSTTARVQELFDLSFSPWVVVRPSLEEAREVHQTFAASPDYMRVEGAGALFPGDLQARAERLRARAPDLAAQRARIEAVLAAAETGQSLPPELEEDQLRLLLDNLLILEEAARRGPPDLDALPEGLRQGVRTEDGGWLTLAYNRLNGLDGLEIRQARLRAQELAPGAVGVGNFIEVGVLGAMDWAGQALLGILFFVSLVVTVDLRSPRWILLALAPVVSAVAMTFGILCWLDVGFTVLTIFSVPLLLGLGVDDGLHVVHRMREDPGLSAAAAAESVGRAIAMTTVTTCSTFFVLLFANHPGMESMALVMLVGLPLCLLGSICLIPALAVVLGLRSAG